MESEIHKALDEVRALDAFDHPNIVRYNYAWVELPPKGWQRASDGNLLNSVCSTKNLIISDATAFLYIQMELCQSTLSEWLANNKERDLSRMKYWFKQIVSAVTYIHDMNKIHRDLKLR
ncbi:hypothetical protein PRIPAC_90463 [Pristionchus pacificus]|nr:hypothetical protein PRIPAC_90463 [Pristionchus pacificus]